MLDDANALQLQQRLLLLLLFIQPFSVLLPLLLLDIFHALLLFDLHRYILHIHILHVVQATHAHI